MVINFQEDRLPNGIRVATAEMPQVSSVAIGIWVGVGGRYESRRMSGISHFIEHLLFKGTKSRSAREISQAIEGRGGYLNAFTQEESTCYYARMAEEHTARGFEVLSDMYLNPRFDAEDIDKERGVIIEEIMMYRDRPSSLVEEMLADLIWNEHPLGRTLIGTPENIKRLTRREILEFKNNRYVSANTVVVMAGKLNHRDCLEQVRKLLGGLKTHKRPGYSSVTRRVIQKSCAVMNKEIEQAHLALGIRLFGRHDPRRYPLKLLSIVLGENMSSRLFQSVREKHGLAYSIQSSVQLFRETGILEIQAGLDRARTLKALKLITEELGRLKQKPVRPGELRRAKDYAIGQLHISLESTTSQMMWVGENLMSYGKFVQPEIVVKRLEEVTSRDIHRVAADVIRDRKISVALIVPKNESISRRQISRTLAQL